MAEFTIQLEAEPGVDVEALAQKLRKEVSSVPAVDDVQAEVMESRDAMVIASTIMLCLTTAPKIIDEATTIVNSLKALIGASKGLHDAVVEVRGRRIPVSKLQPADLAPDAAPGATPAS